MKQKENITQGIPGFFRDDYSFFTEPLSKRPPHDWHSHEIN